MANPRLGKDGALYLTTEVYSSDAALVGNVTDWELSVNQDALERTALGSGFDRTYMPGLRGPVATFNGYYEPADAEQIDLVTQYTATTPNTLMAVLISDSTVGSKSGWKGRAIAQMTQGVAADGIQTISGTLQFEAGISTYSSST